jgi:predicted phosphodiesterase
MMTAMNNCLIISDTHAPYQHRDTLKFLASIQYAYDIQLVKHSGDLADNHTASYHEIEYGTLSAEEEFKHTRKFVSQLNELFPDMTIVLGNHCRLSERKAKTANIPQEHLKSYNMLYDVDWKWVDKDYFKINKYQHCLLTHSQSSSTLNNAKNHSHCCIQGHHHGSFGIEYFSDTETLRWAMTVGCLVDPHSPAFNYARYSTNKRPILGCGAIIEDRPILIPMQLTKSGRWDGKL